MSSAVRNGDAAKVKELLAANPRLVFQQATNILTVRTWQHTAAEMGHTNVMELLIAANADLNVPGDSKSTGGMRYAPLHLGAANGHAGIVRQLLAAGARVDPVDNRGATPLYFALSSHMNFIPTPRDPKARLEAIELLLRNGANVLAPMREYGRTNTPLELALTPSRANFLDVVLTNAQPPTVRDPQGNTLLHLALARGRRAAAEALLRQKADLNATNRAGLTPFQNSLFFGPPQPLDPATGLRMEPPGYWNLLAAGLKPDLFTLAGMGDRAALAERLTADKPLAKNARDGGGRTLLHWASAKGYADVVELLLEYGADAALVDAHGRLPLHEAAQSGRMEILPRLATRELAGREDGSRLTAFELAVQHAQPVAAEWLLRFKPDLSRPVADGQTPLHLVITQGNTDLAAQLLVAGASPAATNRNGQTPLHLAAERGNTNAIIKLINARAPVTLRDRAGVTALDAALAARQTGAARLLLETAPDGPIRAAYLRSAFATAAAAGNLEVMDWLVERGTSLEAVDDQGHTPLTRAIARRDRKLVDTLLERGVSVNGPTNAIATPLSVAVNNGQYAIANLLLERKADLNARATNGNTALHLAFTQAVWDNAADPSTTEHRKQVEQKLVPATMTYSEWVRSTNHFEPLRQYWRIGVTGPDPEPNRWFSHFQRVEDPLKFLLVAGADARQTNAAGQTPVHLLALRKDSPHSVHVSRLEVIVAMMVARGASLDAKDTEGHTALHLAAKAGRVAMAHALLQQGADPKLPLPGGGSVVALALQQPWPFDGVAELVRLLVANGAKVDERDTNGQTVLHHLAKLGNPTQGMWTDPIAAELLKAKVDLDAQDANGDTALHLAIRGGRAGLAAELQKRGANTLLANKAGETPVVLSQKHSDPFNRLSILPPGAKSDFGTASSAGDVETLKVWMKLDSKLAGQTNRNGILPLHQAALAHRTTAADLLLASGAKLDAFTAARLGRAEELRGLLRANPLVATQSWFGAPLLHHAVASSNRAAVEVVLAHVKTASTPNSGGFSTLHFALTNALSDIATVLRSRDARETVFDLISTRQHTALQRMLAGDRKLANATNALGGTPLRQAISMGDTNSVALLLGHGANPNQHWGTMRGRSVWPSAWQTNQATLLHALVNMERNDLAKLLLVKGARVDAFDENGLTPLGVAVWCGNDEAVRLLLERGANPNARMPVPVAQPSSLPPHMRPAGFQPLHVAAQRGRTNAIALLVAGGARLEGTNFAGQTPLEMLVRPAGFPVGMGPGMPLGWSSSPSSSPFPKPGAPQSVTAELLRSLGAKEYPPSARVSTPGFSGPQLPPSELRGR
ncbi:MAG: ankyrin repeat domain-containing protein [Limisphaerales bacterium]